MIKLTLTEKGGEPKLLTFDKDEITIGRVSGNDIVLAKGNVSKRHSRLAMRGSQMEVSDLKSTNGTYVNGRKIAGPTLIGPADRVYVGDFLIGIEGADTGAFASTDAPTSGGSSAARRMPVPPPPPPPPRSSGSNAHLSLEDDGGGGDEEDLGLAARPPRSARTNLPPPPPPPPPPPRRPATPLASRALQQALGDDGFDSSDVPMDDPPHNLEDTGAVGLFAHSRRPDDDGESASTRRGGTGNRPGPAAPAAAAAPSTRERGASGLVSVGDAAGAAPGFEALLNDAAVTQILLTGPDAALVDRGSGLALHTDSLGDANAVADALWRYANTAYPPPAPENPVVDVRLPDGTRVVAVFPPAAPAGVVASVRRAQLPERALADLVPGGSRDVQTLLEALVNTRRNVILTGDTVAIAAALGAFAQAIPADRRVVAIGAGGRARMGWTDLTPTPDMPGLIRVAAALRPDHLVIGEVVGPELAEVVLAATRGCEGLVLAMPGRTPAEVLGRIAALATPGLGGAVTAASLVAAAFDVCLHTVQTPDGQPRIVEVSEPRANAAEVVADVALALYSEGSKRDLGGGRLAGRGVSGRLGAAIAAAGSALPSAVVGK